MKYSTNAFIVFLIVIFIIGALVCLHPFMNRENMINMMQQGESLQQVPPSQHESSCPNILVRSGNNLHLLNTTKPRGPSNPLVFESLEKYLEFLKTQRKNGIRCPILFLQEENNAQGETVYRMRPGPMNMNPGTPIQPVEVLDGSRDRPPFNENHFAGFDPHGQHIGQFTEIDKIHESTQTAKVSDNPMDTNWGGVIFSQSAVDSGKYENRQVGKPDMVPKVLELYK